MEALKVRGQSLQAATTDNETIKKQTKILSTLWDEVVFQTKLRLKVLVELLENIEKFDQVWMSLDVWLSFNEKSFVRQIQAAGSPQKQKERIQKVGVFLYSVAM